MHGCSAATAAAAAGKAKSNLRLTTKRLLKDSPQMDGSSLLGWRHDVHDDDDDDDVGQLSDQWT